MPTIVRKPAQTTLFIKNLMGYLVTQDASHEESRLRLFVETSHGSSVFEFFTELKAFPDENDQALFYINHLFEQDILKYDKPDLFNKFAFAPNICRQIKVSAYDFDQADLELFEEAYQNFEAVKYVDIDELDTATDYIIIVDAESLMAAPVFRRDGASATLATLLYQLGEELWYSLTTTTTQFNEVAVEKGKKVNIFKGTAPNLTTTGDGIGVLLGGYRFENFDFGSLQSPAFGTIEKTGPQQYTVNWTYTTPQTNNNLGFTDNTVWYVEIQYRFNNGLWQNFSSSLKSYNSSPEVQNINETPTEEDSVQFRMRAYVTPNGSSEITYAGPWVCSEIIAEYIELGGNELTLGGLKIKF